MRSLLVRRAVLFALFGVLGWLLLWVVGYTVNPLVMACATAALVLAGWLPVLLGTEPHLPLWPDPSRPSSHRWFGLDPRVRRLTHQVTNAGHEMTEANALRGQLRDELARRLVDRHGADPADPLARAPELFGDQWRHLGPQATRPLNRKSLTALLTRIEEL